MSGTPNNEALNDYNRVFHTVAASLYNLLYVDDSWTQVSDLKGLRSAVMKLYGVDGVAAVWLIDPEGKVVAYNIRGEQLDARLESIFGHK